MKAAKPFMKTDEHAFGYLGIYVGVRLPYMGLNENQIIM